MYFTGLFLTFFGILASMNFRNSGKMLLILVREFWNLVIEKSVKSQGILLFMICGNPVKKHEILDLSRRGIVLSE